LSEGLLKITQALLPTNILYQFSPHFFKKRSSSSLLTHRRLSTGNVLY